MSLSLLFYTSYWTYSLCVQDEDAFGPFSDAAAAISSDSTDPFGVPRLSEDADDTSFDQFGDFGDFQAADGDLTPTGGSWTFASDNSVSSESDDTEVIQIDAERVHLDSDDSIQSGGLRTDTFDSLQPPSP